MGNQDTINDLFQDQLDLVFEQLNLLKIENKRLADENIILANFIKDIMKQDNKTIETFRKVLVDQQNTIAILGERLDTQSESLTIVIENVKEHLLEYANDRSDDEEESVYSKKKIDNNN